MSKSSVLIFNGGSVGEGGSCNVHNLQLGIMTVNLPDFHTSSMYVLLDKSMPIESAPGYAPVDRYALADWIQRGDVIQVDCANITSETDTSYAGALQSTTAVNQQGHVYTSTCTIRLDIKSNNHTESRYYRLEAVHDILTDIWYLGQDINEVTTIINENASNKVQNLDNNSGHYPSCPAVKEAIETAVASVYHAAGPKTVAQLTSALLVAANQGDVYNITDSGTTTADFVEGAGHPIAAGDNVGICDVGGGVYKFDLLSGFVDLSGYLAANGDGSDVTASFTAASTRTNVVTGEKLSALFGKVAKWFGDLKALAFKDKVDTTDLDDDAVTADKVKDGENLPVNVTGSAKSLSSSLCNYGSSGSKFRLVAKSAPLGDTVNVHFECRISASNYNLYQSATLLFNAVYRQSENSIIFSNAKVINDYGSSNLWRFYLVPNIVEHKVEIYAELTSSNYNSLNLIALFANGEGRNYVNGTTYLNTVVNSVPTPNVVVPVMKAVATETGVGSATQPVYVDNNGVVQPCSTLPSNIINTYGPNTEHLTATDVSNGYKDFTKILKYGDYPNLQNFTFATNDALVSVSLSKFNGVVGQASYPVTNFTFEVYAGYESNPTKVLIRSVTKTDLTDTDDRGVSIQDLLSDHIQPVWNCTLLGSQFLVICDRITVRVKWKNASFGSTNYTINAYFSVAVMNRSGMTEWPQE